MAKQARIKFNLTAYRQIRRSAPVERMLGGKAASAAAAGLLIPPIRADALAHDVL